MEEKEVDISKLTKDQKTNYMLQKLIDDYLKLTNSPTMEEILASSGKKNKAGELTVEHNMILQCMVKDYYQASGSTLEEVLKENNLEFKDGVLSTIEQECIEKILIDYCESLTNYLQAILRTKKTEN